MRKGDMGMLLDVTAFEHSGGIQRSCKGFYGQAGSPSNCFFVCGLSPVITLEVTLISSLNSDLALHPYLEIGDETTVLPLH